MSKKQMNNELELVSNCCSAGDDMDGNLSNNEGICSDCKEHCEMVEAE